jgi:predicted AlkP superfamily pyrophosphatase or phosphodiesterase
MKKYIFFLFCSFSIFAQERPKLVVGIVVDQMKAEYLDRFNSDFSENGFKKLKNNGFSYTNMHYNFVPTYTAPGHAAIFTGATPSVNGIVGNDWFNKGTGQNMYCTDDLSVLTLGNGTKDEGEMSPKNLLSTTVTDELRLATNFKGKVIGISVKDRGAILPAGHFANWAFWMSKTGEFISSTFYGTDLPDWTKKFNGEKRYMDYINKGWNLLKPIETYNESLADDNKYEGKVNGEKAVFPYNLRAMFDKSDAGIIKATPFGNDMVAEFAKAAIANEKLGQDNDTDFLTVSFSSTDYVGHILGPRSMELQDTYLRLDNTIADFITYLDKTVGKNNYLLFLTADHAGAENVQFLKDNKYNVTNLNSFEMRKGLQEFSKATFGEDFLLNYSNFNVFLKKDLIATKKLNLSDVTAAFKSYLNKQDFIKRAYTEDEILSNSGSDFILDAVANGYDLQQNGELVLVFKPGFIEYGATGTSHGTVYPYDTHVPMLFYGWNILKGQNSEKKVITQIAPTVALKIKVALPNGTEGKILKEILDTK